ncbi:MAG: hypothetical protein HY301_16705 [Verrucomicrobia bacterium]|nr:hypothetical protein [Verrucomicrobiota bacterium]
MKTKQDDGLEWLREIRRQITGKLGNDPKKLGRHYRAMQRRYAQRLYKREELVAGK